MAAPRWSDRLGAAMAVALLSALAPVPPGESGPSPDLPLLTIDGDWSVSGATSYNDTAILVRGNVTILDGASLTLTRVNLTVEEPWALAHGIEVEGGARLEVVSGSLAAVPPGNPFWMLSRANASLTLRGVTVSGIGGDALNREGLVTWSDGFLLQDCTFTDYFMAVKVSGGVDLEITGNRFLQSRGTPDTYAVRVREASGVRIEDNLFRPGADTGLLSVASPRNLIARNRFEADPAGVTTKPVYATYDYYRRVPADHTTFEDNVLEGTGFYMNAVSHVLVRNNTINNTGYTRWFGIQGVVQIGTDPGTWSRNLTIEGNRITNFGRYGIRLEQNITQSVVRGNRIHHADGARWGEAYGVYLIRAVDNITVEDNWMDMAVPRDDVLTVGISLESRAHDNRVLRNYVANAQQAAVNVEGANVVTPMPGYHRGPALRNVVANNTLVLTRPVRQTLDIVAAVVTWLWSNYTLIENNVIRNYTWVPLQSYRTGFAFRTSCSYQTVRWNTVEGASWGIVFKRFSYEQEDPLYGTYNRSGNVVYGNLFRGIANASVVSDESDGFGPIRNVVLAVSDRVTAGLPEFHAEAVDPIQALTWKANGVSFTATLRTRLPTTGGVETLTTAMPLSGSPATWSVSGLLDRAGTRGGLAWAALAPAWEYRVPTIGPTREAVTVGPRMAYEVSASSGGAWENGSAASGDNGLAGVAVNLTGLVEVRWTAAGGLPPAANVSAPVTITTDPAGESVLVDGVARTTPYATQWNYSEPHALEAAEARSLGPGSRRAFAFWSDGGARVHDAVLAAQDEHLTASKAVFSAPYSSGDYLGFLFASTNRYREELAGGPFGAVTWMWAVPAGLDVDFAVFLDADCDGTYGPGAALNGLAAATGLQVESLSVLAPDAGCYWVHAVTPDGTAATFEEFRFVTKPVPTVLTATFRDEHLVRIQTDPEGVPLTVDGTLSGSTLASWWESGSVHTLGAQDVSASGTTFYFLSWSDGGGATHNVTASGPLNLTARFESAEARRANALLIVGAGLGVLLAAVAFVSWRRRRPPGTMATAGGPPDPGHEASAPEPVRRGSRHFAR